MWMHFKIKPVRYCHDFIEIRCGCISKWRQWDIINYNGRPPRMRAPLNKVGCRHVPPSPGRLPQGHISPEHLPPGRLPPGHLLLRTYAPEDIYPIPLRTYTPRLENALFCSCICIMCWLIIFSLSGMVKSPNYLGSRWSEGEGVVLCPSQMALLVNTLVPCL